MNEFEEKICLQLKLTKNIMEMEHNKYLKPHKISTEQGLLLKYALDHPGSTQTQIAEGLHKDKTTITRMIDTLIKNKKLYRKNSKNDRRIFNIYLTKETEQLAEELEPLFDKMQKDLEEIIDQKDYEIALKVLSQIQEYYKGLNK